MARQTRSAGGAAQVNWEAALTELVGAIVPVPRPAPEEAELGLQFEVLDPGTTMGRKHGIAMRPVVPGRTSWVRSGISWSNLGYYHHDRFKDTDRHRRLLAEIMKLSIAVTDAYYYYGHQQPIYLDGIGSRRIWDLLAEAQEAGVPLVQAGKWAAPVVVGLRPVRMSLQVDRVDGHLLLAPTLMADGVPVDPERSVWIGEPAHGIAWWGVQGEAEGPAKDRVLRLAPLARTLSKGMIKALGGAPIRIPEGDEQRFFEAFYPELLREVDVVAAGASVRLPGVGPSALTLTLTPLPGQRMAVQWEWMLPVGEHRHTEPLWATAPAGQADHRDGIVRRVADLVGKPVPDLLEFVPAGPRLAASATVTGDAMIRLLGEVVPRLQELESVDVVLAKQDESVPDYRETCETPVITFAGADGDVQQDWFDLSVRVSVGGEQVVFDELFVALAQDRQYLILPTGAYFSLDRPEFQQLRDLIAESRALEDTPPGILRVGRFQAGLWDELAELGMVTGQAAAWQESVRALSMTGAAVEHEVPELIRAELRPYQREGFRWLAALHEHGLGGILADDMGLGKTLQALALICHARSRGPFLVVAPASVVHNWASEAARFAPGLAVATVTQTLARRGAELA